MSAQSTDASSALSRPSVPRGDIFAFSVAAVVTLGIQLYLWPHITDDAYITFRYAFHLASGDGLVFNPGERVEGFSNPLWTLLLGGLFALTDISLPDLARGIGLLCALGTLAMMVLMFRQFPGSLGVAPLSLSLMFLLLTPGFHVYATAGLEGPLLSFLLVTGLLLSLAPGRPGLSAALLFGLVGITRPEGPLYALLWFLATIQTEDTPRETVRKEIPRFLVMMFPVVGWQIFRLLYFGEWIPNTAVAKVAGVFGEFISLPDYVAPWLIALGGPLILLVWIFVPPDPALQRIERVSLAITGGTAVFVAYAQGDWMNFGRFIVPAWPLVATVFPLWLSTGWKKLISATEPRFRKGLAAMPFVSLLLCAFLAWRPAVEDYIENKGMNMLMRGMDQIAVGRWIHENIAPGATIATGRLGGIGYGAMNNVVWDWFGLTDAEEARFIRRGRPGTLADDPVFRRKPDVVAAIEAPADWSYKRTVQVMNYLQDDYQFIIGFPQGTYGYVDIWIRRERLDEIFLTREQYVLPSPDQE